MRKILIFVLALFLLAPVSINATESDGTEETIEVRSNDVTGTWSAINNGSTNTHVNVLAIDPSNPSIIYAAGEHGLFKSTDGGEHWSAGGLTKEIYAVVIDPSNPSIVYAGARHAEGIFKTTDRGEHWVHINPGFPGVFEDFTMIIDPKNPSIFYASSNWQGGTVGKSTDGGEQA